MVEEPWQRAGGAEEVEEDAVARGPAREVLRGPVLRDVGLAELGNLRRGVHDVDDGIALEEQDEISILSPKTELLLRAKYLATEISKAA